MHVQITCSTCLQGTEDVCDCRGGKKTHLKARTGNRNVELHYNIDWMGNEGMNITNQLPPRRLKKEIL